MPSARVRTAPSGILPRVMESVSEPSVSIRADWISRAMAVSSFPTVSVVSRAGASATAVTETFRVPEVTAVSVPSVEVAVISRAMSPEKSVGGVRLRPVSWSGDRVAVPPVTGTTVPSAMVRTDPSGILPMVTLSVSPESVNAASMLRAMA